MVLLSCAVVALGGSQCLGAPALVCCVRHCGWTGRSLGKPGWRGRVCDQEDVTVLDRSGDKGEAVIREKGVLGLVPSSYSCVTNCPQLSGLTQRCSYLLHCSVSQEFGQGSAGLFFCLTWYRGHLVIVCWGIGRSGRFKTASFT